MLTIDQCKEYLKGLDLTDEEIEKLRDNLHRMINLALDRYFEKSKGT